MGEAGGDGELLRQYRLLGRTGEGSQSDPKSNTDTNTDTNRAA